MSKPIEKTCPDCNETYFFKHECKKKEPVVSNRKKKKEKQNKRGA
jgi:hypothetical protein